ncbi:MAG: DUF4411 family protein [Bacteroidetes bacterium]|nr:DUF4411 family protein [Bacteroidota bacterium]
MYLIDSNVFISAQQNHYSFDFHPGFWDWLILSNQNKRVYSIRQVYEEISVHKDQLYMWASDFKNTLFLPDPSDLGLPLNKIAIHVKQNYRSEDVKNFLVTADYFLIAHALLKNWKVVTHEVRKPTKAKIKIPTVCDRFNVECIDPFEMLRQEKPQFVLDLGK